MSTEHESKTEHGTVEAYVIGFILSLVLTFIPYSIVTNQSTAGTKLLAVILGFGVLQMLVQLLFFLHLGRKPRPVWQILFLIWTIASVLIVISGSIIIIHNLHNNMAPSDQIQKLTNDEGISEVNGRKTGACSGQHNNHQVVLSDTNVTPAQTNAKQCDTLSFVNQSGEAMNITFAQKSAEKPYAGVDGYTVRAGMNKTITLSETGTYQFKAVSNPSISGEFTVYSAKQY